ncbi:MAG: hypothetical protein LBS46_02080 [Dysgonamonadaceae bacterium]|jgi:hypothetical protein|nr:hypothetical protein [Dysgonamonadaceae bacterium]
MKKYFLFSVACLFASVVVGVEAFTWVGNPDKGATIWRNNEIVNEVVIPLNSGIYFVKSGNDVPKIIVK